MARAKPVRVIDPGNTSVAIFGCGGTGGALLQNLARLLYGLKENRKDQFVRREYYDPRPTSGATPPVLVVDGDTVAEKNILRQPFVPGDVGEKKAILLSKRLGAAYGPGDTGLPELYRPRDGPWASRERGLHSSRLRG